MKILIIRFSSFGDILQCLSVPSLIKTQYPEAQVHWAVREDSRELLDSHPKIDRVWGLSRKQGLGGLLQLARELRAQQFTHIYDAHNNLRSNVLSKFVPAGLFVRRPKNRWKRILLFRFKKNLFSKP